MPTIEPGQAKVTQMEPGQPKVTQMEPGQTPSAHPESPDRRQMLTLRARTAKSDANVTRTAKSDAMEPGRHPCTASCCTRTAPMYCFLLYPTLPYTLYPALPGYTLLYTTLPGCTLYVTGSSRHYGEGHWAQGV